MQLCRPQVMLYTTLLLGAGACASSGASTSETTTSETTTAAAFMSAAAPTRRNENIITRAELDATPGITTVYEAVIRLRPRYLRADSERRSLSTNTATGPSVRLDNADFGGLDALKQIAVGDVQEVRYLQPSEATARFGVTDGRAVIHVMTRRP